MIANVRLESEKLRRARAPRAPAHSALNDSYPYVTKAAILTRLNSNHRDTDGNEPLALEVPPDPTLEPRCGDIAADLLDKIPREHTTPPSLYSDRGFPKCPVLLDGHAPPHILLNNRNKRVEAVGAEGLQGSEHARTEEDLGQSRLVLVWVVNRLLEDASAKRLQFKVFDHGLPLRRVY